MLSEEKITEAGWMAGSRTERLYYIGAARIDSNEFTGQQRSSYSVYELSRPEATRAAGLVAAIAALERKASEEDRSMTRRERADFERMNRELTGIVFAAGRRVHYTRPVAGTPLPIGTILDQAQFSRIPVRSTETLKAQAVGR
ncbi:MAG: hypothetical protein AB1324_07160 [Candidatus Micrarchaeota archaeon]